MSTVHTPTVRPGMNPGGLWIRLCTARELLDEHALNNRAVECEAALDGELAGLYAAERGETVWCYVYDGDSGTCMATILTEAEP